MTVVCLLLTPVSHADQVDLQVYKGELRILVPDEQTRNSLMIRYRTKTRQVLRFAIDDLTLTNMRTKQVLSLPDQFSRLENRIDPEGFWYMDISYNGLNLGQDNYRIKGRLSLYLIGSQRSSNFSAYLEPRTDKTPAGSSID